ncbi:hypothetical protein FN846DRAFT_301210 [Neofusicoccum parvum]|uniref:Uncharacterized protein n=1 Tax=Neofusicoccum parvum TaxID=310453 RepID=A0ACB5SBV3_9PEZI|nr:hypothetical protein FN846DRAFT_301210 [Neofusicoccum parvum]
MDEKRRVDSFHLGLGKPGDSSIHLVVKEHGGSDEVEWAMLVDGGTSACKGHVTSAIQAIQGSGKYQFATPKKLTFDCVVISHWDADHYGGLLAAIAEDITRQAVSDSVTPFEKIRISFFRYGSKGEPKTIVYCPGFGYETTGFPRFDHVHRRNDPPISDSTFIFETGFSVGRGKMVDKACKICVEFTDYTAGQFRTMLGANLVTGKFLADGGDVAALAASVGSPSDLIETHKAIPGRPGIYIVAVSDRTIGTNPTPPSGEGGSRALSASYYEQHHIDADLGPDRVFIIDEGTSHSTPKNKSSIACLIMWPGNPPRLSQYFAGDLFWEKEQALVEWTKTTGTRTVGKWVPTVKASHHGAKSSTPISLLDNFKPQNLIASVGDKHGHPSWELVFYLTGWFHSDGLKGARKPLLATRFPYYLLKQVDPKGHDGDDTNEYATYRRKLIELYKKSQINDYGNTQSDGPLEALSKRIGPNLIGRPAKDWTSKDKECAEDFIREHMAKTWDSVSPIDPSVHPYDGAVVCYPNVDVVQPSKTLRWYRVEAHDDDKTDGDAFIQYSSDSLEKQHVDGISSTRAMSQPVSAVLDVGILGTDLNFSMYPQAASNVDVHTGMEIEPWHPKGSAVASSYDTYGIPQGTNPNEMEMESWEGSDAEQSASEGWDPIVRPAPGLPHAPSGPGAPLDRPCYFICASTIKYESGTPGAEVKQLTPANAMNNFLSTLHLRGLLLSNKPASATGDVKLHHQDELLLWFSLALECSVASPLSASVKADDAGNITSFSIEAPSLGATFSSEATAQVLAEAVPGPAGTVPWQNSLILGLQTAERAQGLTLTDMLAPARARNISPAGMDLVALVLGDEARFDVDTGEGSRSAIWFEPMSAYKTVVRTQYTATQTSLDGLERWVAQLLPGLTVESVKVITGLKCRWAPTSKGPAALSEWEFVLTAGCALDGVDVKPAVTLDFAEEAVTVVLQFDYAESAGEKLLPSVLDWLGKRTGAEHAFRECFERGGANFSLPLVRRVRLVLDRGQVTAQAAAPSVQHINVELELGVNFGQPTVDGKVQKVVFLFTYQWTKGRGSSLDGCLWCPPPADSFIDRRLLVEYEPHLQLQPSSVSGRASWADGLDLVELIPADPTGAPGGKIVHIPDGIPTRVEHAVLQLDGSAMSLEGAIVCREPASNDIPKLPLSSIRLNASYAFATKQFHIDFDFGALMWTQPGSSIPPIQLRGSVMYDSAGEWALQGSVETQGMQCAHLLNFFDDETGPAATALVQHVRLNYLSLSYHYAKDAGKNNPASGFEFAGSMSIGSLDLGLTFRYMGPKQWTFETNGSVSGDECSLQAILDSIVGDGTVELPPFVGDMTVGRPSSSGAQEFFRLTVAAQPLRDDKPLRSRPGARMVAATVTVNVGPVSFTFAQFRRTGWSVDKNPSKRFLRVDVTELPHVDIPLVGRFAQPFDKMCFVWVQDGSKTATAKQVPGLTLAEVDELNEMLPEGGQVYYRQVKGGSDVVVQAGYHFMLVADGTVVLDYVLPPSSKKKVPPPAAALAQHGTLQQILGPGTRVESGGPMACRECPGLSRLHLHMPREKAPATDTPASGTTKAPFAKTIGSLAISNIGLAWRGGTLSLCLDAEVHAGPIALALKGFSIDVGLSKHTLQGGDLPVGFTLEGMAVALDRPPLALAGGLARRRLPSGDFFTGGVAVAFSEWAFLAAGGYGRLRSGGRTVDSAFVFARLDGPLVTLEFATLSGLTGGIGYNSALALPTVDQVPEFPFLKMPAVAPGPGTGNATMDTLQALLGTHWFAPQADAFWVGAGLTVTACQMLDVAAVAVVKWDPDVTLAVNALAVANVPSDAAAYKLAHFELGIVASVNWGRGVASFEAQLAPSSFILDPSCHLSGGFALRYWFADGAQQTKGAWVFTMGGYHARYTPPPQYPNPPRLQIAWALGPLAITGQAYFAMTPAVCMAGGSLHVALAAGVLEAFLDVAADFLIAFQPFSFAATSRVSVGVRYRLDLWFVTLHISVDIAASVALQGPPVAGTCHVDFWVFGFDIHFGSAVEQRPEPASLPEFFDLALQKGNSPGVSLSAQQQQQTPAPHVFRCLSGIFADPLPAAAAPASADAGADDADAMWTVHAGTFSFSLTCVFAVSSMTVYPGGEEPMVRDAATAPIYSTPMRLGAADKPLGSALAVTLERVGSDGDDERYEPQWELSPVVSNVPRGLWGEYDPSTDPLRVAGSSSNSVIPLTTGWTFVAPPPDLADDRIPEFDAVRSQLQTVLDPPPPLPDAGVWEDGAWIPVSEKMCAGTG